MLRVSNALAPTQFIFIFMINDSLHLIIVGAIPKALVSAYKNMPSFPGTVRKLSTFRDMGEWVPRVVFFRVTRPNDRAGTSGARRRSMEQGRHKKYDPDAAFRYDSAG